MPVTLALFLLAAAARPSPDALASWLALDAPTGHEHLATDPLQSALSGWERDRAGNLLRRVGSGTPRRVVACGLDGHGFVASQITADGYLRLHRVGPGTGHPLWDQAHEGQQVRVLTEDGPVLGVTAIANGHFAQQHRDETRVVSADDLWVDVGATSADEVEALGIRLLDPVRRHFPAWSYAEEVAGPGAGARLGCAAVVAASQGEVASGETVFVLSTQHVFGWVGLGAAVTALGRVDEVTFVADGEVERRDEPAGDRLPSRLTPVLERAGVTRVRWLAPEVRDPGSIVERFDVAEAERLLDAVRDAAGLASEASASFVEAPAPAAIRAPETDAASPRGLREARAAELLATLAEIPAVPEREAPVRRRVLERLPEWARGLAEVDAIGNVTVAVGPETEATVFVAHMDEVGFHVAAVAADGTVSLERRGGVVVSAWEGQPARLQLEDPDGELDELPGVFLTRSDPKEKRPEEVRAWFGMDGAALAARGVRPGLGVTGYKEAHRIGPHRFTSRALDDRAGTIALLLAIARVDREALDHRVVFAWSVQEEGGLDGAFALAKRLGAATRRVFSVDTFVSSDTPLESPHFAFAPLGAGPVLRAIENSSLSPPVERRRTLAIARAAGLAPQIGLTQGGTDGTNFTFWGAPNAGLSWPGRYSHSPAEVLDLRDLVALSDLILAEAEAPDSDQ